MKYHRAEKIIKKMKVFKFLGLRRLPNDFIFEQLGHESIWQLGNTNIRLTIRKPFDEEIQFCWAVIDRGKSTEVSFEDLLSIVDPKLGTVLLFHLDLFR